MTRKGTLVSGWFMLAVVSLICIAIVFEVFIRFTIGAPRSSRLPLLRVKPDPELGYKPLPGDVHYGYERLIKLNQLGLRGPEIEAKQADEVRILVLGETQAYGLGLADHELVTHVFEQALNESLDAQCFRVINFGVRAYNLNQQLGLLENTGLDLAPDHVVVLFYVYSFGRFDINTYYERVRKQDWYMLDLGSNPNKTTLLKWKLKQHIRKSALIAWSHYLYKNRRARAGLIGILLSEKGAIPASHIAYAREHLIRLQDLAHEHGFRISLVVLPLPQQLIGADRTDQYQSLLRRLASEQGLAFFDLLPSLKNLYQQSDRLPVAPFDDHYDAAAHKTMGLELANWMRERYPRAAQNCL